MSRLYDWIARGTRGAQAAAAASNKGMLYWVTDESKLERSSGSAWESMSSSKVLQVANTQTGAVATGTTVIPFDNSIPQNTEGDQYMTLAFTPTNAGSKLKIEVVVFATVTTTPFIIVALFQDSVADALAASAAFNSLSGGGMTITFTHYMTAGSTSLMTFKVRIGPSSAATITFNGSAGGRIFGGVAASSITITEIGT